MLRLRRLLILTTVMLLALLLVALKPGGAVAGAPRASRPSHSMLARRPMRAASHRRPPVLVKTHPARAQSVRPASATVRRGSVATPVVIRVAGVASGADGQAAVDRCAGPVEVLWSAYGYANDIIQHNYCGGAWMAFIRPGLEIRIVGGTQPGLYVANGQRRVAPKDSTIAVMAGIGDLALQTCQGRDLVYTGLSRIRA